VTSGDKDYYAHVHEAVGRYQLQLLVLASSSSSTARSYMDMLKLGSIRWFQDFKEFMIHHLMLDRRSTTTWQELEGGVTSI
jgi:hypothetical protein